MDIARDIIFKPDEESKQGQTRDVINNTKKKSVHRYRHIEEDKDEEESNEEEEMEEQSEEIEGIETFENEQEIEESEDEENFEETVERLEESGRILRNRNLIKKPSRWQDYHTCLFGIMELDEPLTYEEAMADDNRNEWRKAIEEELQVLAENMASG